jgi:hypothetical protein
MPIDGTLLGMQRRAAPLGELRIGTSVAVPGKDYRKPVRLNAFRFTTSVEMIADAVAAKYGGTVAPWTQRRGRWEVITDRAALDVWVPPSGNAVDTNMELWDGPRRLRQCNGRIESIGGRPCSCPLPRNPDDPVSVRQAHDERQRLAKLRPPQACSPLTRINVTIPDLPGLVGVWRWNTGSENAAVETAGAGDTMTIARDGDVYLPAVATFQWRYRSDDGSPYPVPLLIIGVSMRDLAQGQLPAGPGGLIAQLRGPAAPEAVAGGEQAKAITTGTGSDAGDDGVITGKVVSPSVAAQEPPEDPEGGGDWLDATLTAARTLTTNEQAAALWRQSSARYRDGLCTLEAATAVQDMIRCRRADLAEGAA